MKRTVLLSAFSLFSLFLASQNLPDSCRLQVGTNLAGPVDWGSEYPFVNIMKYAREWITHNNAWIGGGQNLWDTGVLDQIPLDEDGYPLYLPVDLPGQEAPQIVRTVWANTEALPEGTYVVLWDGTGDLDVWGDATLISESPGRLEFELQYSGDLFALEIYESQPGDHVRNIRVLMPGTESSYQTQPWEPNWLQKLEPFNALRFMDWGYTNNSDMRHWDQRTLPTDYTWTQKSGVPYEQWIELCNLKKADAWICVPHAADDEYVTNLATLFRDQLDPDLKIYVEYSNEVWNWIFDQAHYGLDSLDQNLPWPERLAPRIGHVMQIWTDVFSGQTDRLERVLAVQHGWYDIGRRIFLQLETEFMDHLIDAISPAAYMGLDNDYISANWGTATTGQEVLDHAAGFTFDPAEYAMQGWYQYSQLAAQNGKRLLFYEGGQHFTPSPFGTVQPYCDALVECQTLPGMYDLYNQLFDTLRTLSDQEMLFMNFSFISPTNCQYGSWGILQDQFDEQPPYDNAPKYRAVTEAAALYQSCAPATATKDIRAEAPVKVFPNPTNDLLNIEWSGLHPDELTVQLFDLTGKEQPSPISHNQLSLATLPAGIYFLRVNGNGQTVWVKVVKRG
ncbi:MAG: hypothetical protein CMN32_10835 [Saprospirales bacterium]|nr:hypothetical protein [Saprospirales bacterium]